MPTNGNGSATASASSILENSLAALSKSAHQAFAEVENQARQDVAKANSDAREARLDRDKALEALHAAQLDSQVLQKEVANAKASLSHHKEIIAQLRREATQWKDQSRNWQEHFLRVEQERCNLSTRVEELVAERLSWNRSLPTLFTPNYPVADDVSSAPLPKPIRTSTFSRKHPISPPDVDSPSIQMSGHKSTRIASKPIRLKHSDSTPPRPLFSRDPSASNHNIHGQNNRTRKTPVESPTQPPARTTVIRRVHALINVKQEGSEEESVDLDEEATIAPSTTKRVSPRKRKAIHQAEDYVSGEESDHAPLASDQSYEEDEDEQDVDDDDDELMLGAEDDDLYNKRGRSLRSAPDQSLSTSPTKKRKVVAGRNKPPARRKN
ncbi:hypothetical protein DXG01_011963 [Tephrocybe rancida]|nr:hypothetical protein DXG01_011963 [Tephrocybe rancida]